MTMTTNTETLILDVKGTGKLDVDWSDVVEKVNSRPVTPKSGVPETAEMKSASPPSNSSERRDGQGGTQSKSTIRLVQKSDEEDISKISDVVEQPASSLLPDNSSSNLAEQKSQRDLNTFSTPASVDMHPNILEEKGKEIVPQSMEQPSQQKDGQLLQSTTSATMSSNQAQEITLPTTNSNTDSKPIVSLQNSDSDLSNAVNIPLPPTSKDEEQELQEPSATKIESDKPQTEDGILKEDPKHSPTLATSSLVHAEQAKEAREKSLEKAPAQPGVSNKDVSNRKTLNVFGTLKKKISTHKIRPEREESTDPLTKTTTKVSSSSSKDDSEHVEFKKKTPPTSPMENKKVGGLFKSIRAAIKLSKSSTKSPSIKSATSPVTPVSPVTPLSAKPLEKINTKSSQRSTERSISNLSSQKSMRHAEKPLSKQPSQRYPTQPTSRNSVRQPQRPVYASLRTASTWSPAASNPVLASNPNAKMYTVWPRYPIVDTQITEVQELLESFLPNDKSAIETSREPDSQVVIHYWKAPLTAEQAEVVKDNNFVSSIQLSKLDYDPSDLFC